MMNLLGPQLNNTDNQFARYCHVAMNESISWDFKKLHVLGAMSAALSINQAS